MRTVRVSCLLAVVAGVAVFFASWDRASARQAPGGAIAVDSDDLGGVVTGPKGPEAERLLLELRAVGRVVGFELSVEGGFHTGELEKIRL